jgi:hypothetical protein
VNERLQAAVVAAFLLIVAGAVAVLLMQRDEEPAANPATKDGNVLDSAESPPTGLLAFESGRKGMLLRLRYGSCTQPGGPKLEISTNFGRSFQTVRIPQIDTGRGIDATSPTVPSIVRASAASPRRLAACAADRECGVRAYTSTDGGSTWKKKSGRPNAWYMDPKTGVSVSPKGPTDNGCKKSALLAPVNNSTAVVVCENGTVRRTVDSGGSWTAVGQRDDVTSVAFGSPTTGYATTREKSCASRVQVTTDGGATWRPAGCVIKEFAIPALAVVGDRLVAGGTAGALMSEDQGQTWAPSKKK